MGMSSCWRRGHPSPCMTGVFTGSRNLDEHNREKAGGGKGRGGVRLLQAQGARPRSQTRKDPARHTLASDSHLQTGRQHLSAV